MSSIVLIHRSRSADVDSKPVAPYRSQARQYPVSTPVGLDGPENPSSCPSSEHPLLFLAPGKPLRQDCAGKHTVWTKGFPCKFAELSICSAHSPVVVMRPLSIECQRRSRNLVLSTPMRTTIPRRELHGAVCCAGFAHNGRYFELQIRRPRLLVFGSLPITLDLPGFGSPSDGRKCLPTCAWHSSGNQRELVGGSEGSPHH